MTNVVFRKGTRVFLRPIERTDITTMRKWMNDPEVTQFLKRVFPLMETEEEEWFQQKHRNKHDYSLAMVTVEEKKLIGSIGLHRINWHHRTATTGTVIGEKEYWSRGYGTEAKMLLLDFAFNALDLHTIASGIFAHNGRSIKYGLKCGYEEVARIPQWIRGHDGKRYDEVILIVTQEKWRPLWEKYLAERDAKK